MTRGKKKRAGGGGSDVPRPLRGRLIALGEQKVRCSFRGGDSPRLPATQARILPGAVSGSGRGEQGAAARWTGAECCREEPGRPCLACEAPEVVRSPTSGRPSTGSLPLSHDQVIRGAASAWWGAEQLLGQGRKAVSFSPLTLLWTSSDGKAEVKCSCGERAEEFFPLILWYGQFSSKNASLLFQIVDYYIQSRLAPKYNRVWYVNRKLQTSFINPGLA